ncbi:terminase small subunit [Faecalicatena contorta]|uniref:Phage terminase small subunit n=1 Tax=Faecalicatena contorta TaxID=39482 RepID=A0A315ZXV0_9FIRM|nr:terminase small subunit [Faecalicatena contorta]PWJ49344.1 phage terminase small subunit [Faecalicatena contorta]SUQ14588.1 phage terminase small subunit [Faecalicatena contorta]
MARSRSPDSIKAEELFHSGMSLVDIAKKLKKPEGTVRRWKSTQGWEDKGERSEKKSERKASVRKQNKENKIKAIADDVSQVIENPDLTDKQRLFCLHYVKCFNATKAYQKAYGCSYETAMTEGCNLLRNPKIKAQILQLKQNRFNREMLDESDIFQKYMDIAFSDITNYVEFGNEEIEVTTKNGDTKEITVSYVNIKDSSQVDGSLIREVSQGREGIKVKLLDQMKALDWLTTHMDFATPEQREKLKLLEAQRKALEKGNNDEDNNEDIIIIDSWSGDENEED